MTTGSVRLIHWPDWLINKHLGKIEIKLDMICFHIFWVIRNIHYLKVLTLDIDRFHESSLILIHKLLIPSDFDLDLILINLVINSISYSTCKFKRIVYPKMKMVIIYSPSCHSKHVWVSFLCWTQKKFCHDNSRRDWHGNVRDNVNVFGLGGIDATLLQSKSRDLLLPNYIHNMLLWACKKYCCCKYIIHERTPYTIHESPRSRSIQVEVGKVEGFWSMLRNCYNKH